MLHLCVFCQACPSCLAVPSCFFDRSPAHLAAHTRLPRDVVVTGCVEVPHTFHPQAGVALKQYSYCLRHGCRTALARATSWFVGPRLLDVAAMQRACGALEGSHDFSSFSHSSRGSGARGKRDLRKAKARGFEHERGVGAGASASAANPAAEGTRVRADASETIGVACTGGGDAMGTVRSAVDADGEVVGAGGGGDDSDDGESLTHDNVRTMTRVRVREVDAFTLAVELEAAAFTRGLARNLVGCLVAVGQGKVDAAGIPAVFAAKDRAAAPEGAPAHGLCLEWIRYLEDVTPD